MKTSIVMSLMLIFSLLSANLYASNLNVNVKPRPAGCKPNCDGIPAGQCSCVSIDYYKCCGKKTDGLKTKTKNQDKKPAATIKY